MWATGWDFRELETFPYILFVEVKQEKVVECKDYAVFCSSNLKTVLAVC